MTCQRYVIHRTEEQGLTQRKQMTCLSSKGRREVAELLAICRKCPHTFCWKERQEKKRGFSFFRDPLL